jgi:WD40 repeat protein
VKVQNSERYVKVMQWFAHQAQINSITFLDNPHGILTCSTDRHVKLWSLDGELWGDINLLKENTDKMWTYPFDWSEKKVNEIERVKKIMALVDPPKPSDEEV